LNFIKSGIVPDHARSGFEAAVESTRNLLKSTTAEMVAILLAYIVVVGAIYSQPIDQLPSWQRSSGGTPIYSMAGWWHILVSLPLLLVLFFGWMWRLALWAPPLWLISRLDCVLWPPIPIERPGSAL
jgi:hypothetical protein